MPHVSADGLVQPPYVNVAFRQEEIGEGAERRMLLLLLLLVVR